MIMAAMCRIEVFLVVFMRRDVMLILSNQLESAMIMFHIMP